MSTFQKSEKITNLTKSLLNFSINIRKIKKESTNPFFRSKYASLPDIQDAISGPLQENGLVIVQLPDEENLVTILYHAETGEYIMATSTMKPVKNDPQGIGSAITYQRRYSIASLLNLNIDDDDDGNYASRPKNPSVNKRQIEELNRLFNSLKIDEGTKRKWLEKASVTSIEDLDEAKANKLIDYLLEKQDHLKTHKDAPGG